jgi:hypothetical protein
MRRILLHEIAGASLGDLAANWQDGRVPDRNVEYLFYQTLRNDHTEEKTGCDRQTGHAAGIRF